MQSPQFEPSVSDIAPEDSVLTGYDELHLITYLRLLDAEAEGTDWQEVAKIVLNIDPAQEYDRAKRAWESHIARAKWIAQSGYRHLLRSSVSH
jgi:hypothetical protein